MRDWPRFAAGKCESLAFLITIVARYGDRALFFTDLAQDIKVGAVTYHAAPGCMATGVDFSDDGTIANGDIVVAESELGSTLAARECAVGLYDGADFSIELIDAAAPADGSIVLLSGQIGPVEVTVEHIIKFTLRSVLARQRAIVSEQMSAMCRAELGDDRCKIAILPADVARSTAYIVARSGAGTLDYDFVNSAWARVRAGAAGDPSDYANLVLECTGAGTTAAAAPDYSGITAGSVITDGSAQFTARDSYTRFAKIDSIVDGFNVLLDRPPDPRAVDGWFSLGELILRSGPNAGFALPVSNWLQASNQASFFLDASPFIVGGEWVEIVKGCDKRATTCNGTFSNIINRRAEDLGPGGDLLKTIPPAAAPSSNQVSWVPIT
jgi:hypothetical protein